MHPGLGCWRRLADAAQGCSPHCLHTAGNALQAAPEHAAPWPPAQPAGVAPRSEWLKRWHLQERTNTVTSLNAFAVDPKLLSCMACWGVLRRHESHA